MVDGPSRRSLVMNSCLGESSGASSDRPSARLRRRFNQGMQECTLIRNRATGGRGNGAQLSSLAGFCPCLRLSDSNKKSEFNG